MKFDYKTEYNRYKRYYRDLTPLFKKPVVKAYTMLVLSLLTMSVFGFFAIRPTIKTIVGLNKEIKDARFTDKSLQEKINQLSDAQQEYTKVQVDMPVILASLPKDSAFQSLLRQIEGVANQSGASISGINFSDVNLFGSDEKKKATSSSALGEVPFKINLNGSYRNLFSIIKILNRIERLVGIDSVSISSKSSLEQAGLSVNISAKAFFFP